MAVPKKRMSKSRKGMRRAHDHLIHTAAVDTCSACGEPKLRHRVCEACGTYKGRTVINVEAD